MDKEIFFAKILRIYYPPESYNSDLLLETFEVLPTLKSQAIAIGKWTRENGFLLMKDSFIKKQNTASTNDGIHEILLKVKNKGYLLDFENFPDYYLLTTDIHLSSPSRAACLVHGYDAGRKLWQSHEGKSINELLNVIDTQ